MTSEKTNDHTSTIVLLSATSIVLLACIGFGYVYWYKRKQKSQGIITEKISITLNEHHDSIIEEGKCNQDQPGETMNSGECAEQREDTLTDDYGLYNDSGELEAVTQGGTPHLMIENNKSVYRPHMQLEIHRPHIFIIKCRMMICKHCMTGPKRRPNITKNKDRKIMI